MVFYFYFEILERDLRNSEEVDNKNKKREISVEKNLKVLNIQKKNMGEIEILSILLFMSLRFWKI